MAYSKQRLSLRFPSVNWQELYGLLSDIYKRFNLAEFRGYVREEQLDKYARLHWQTLKNRRGFGELMVLNASGGSWKTITIKFYDRCDDHRFIKIDVDCQLNRLTIDASLDSTAKLTEALERIVGVFKVPLNSWLRIVNGTKKSLSWQTKIGLFLVFIGFVFYYPRIDWEKFWDPQHWLKEKFHIPFKRLPDRSDRERIVEFLKGQKEHHLAALFEPNNKDVQGKAVQTDIVPGKTRTHVNIIGGEVSKNFAPAFRVPESADNYLSVQNSKIDDNYAPAVEFKERGN